MNRQVVWLDPSWRRMDELFSAKDEAELRASHEVMWGRDEPAPEGLLERLLEELSFEAPEMKMGRVPINAAYVKQRLDEIAQDEDLSQFIL